MTGPGPGKIPVEGTVNLVLGSSVVKLEPCNIYIHVKGYSRARVTHVDIESPKLNIKGYREGIYAYVHGLPKGFKLILKRFIRINEEYIKEVIVRWEGPKVLEVGKSSIAYVGIKERGIYVGFRREVIRVLEEFSRKVGVIPK